LFGRPSMKRMAWRYWGPKRRAFQLSSEIPGAFGKFFATEKLVF